MGRTRAWDRELRVFVSSTFSDLVEVRDLLAKKVFPRVRVHSEELGISFTDVDLRWGVTEEAIDQGRLRRLLLWLLHWDLDVWSPHVALGER
jgi:hypothetical protein